MVATSRLKQCVSAVYDVTLTGYDKLKYFHPSGDHQLWLDQGYCEHLQKLAEVKQEMLRTYDYNTRVVFQHTCISRGSMLR